MTKLSSFLSIIVLGVLLIPTTIISMTMMETLAVFPLNDGKTMAQVGLGVYRADPGEECYQAVRWGLEVGYRLIDTGYGRHV
jgi:hypothetical protein